MFSWIAAYGHLLREAQAKLAETTDPAERAAYEKQAKQWEARLKEEESRSASGNNAGPDFTFEHALRTI
jgi:hypothetical protein